MSYLMTPAVVRALNDAGAYSTTSTSYVPVDSNFTLAMVTSSGNIQVGVDCALIVVTGNVDFAIGMDGGSEVLVFRASPGTYRIGRSVIFTGLSPGQHTPTLRWRINTGSVTMRGADNGGVPYPPIQFWAIER